MKIILKPQQLDLLIKEILVKEATFISILNESIVTSN